MQAESPAPSEQNTFSDRTPNIFQFQCNSDSDRLEAFIAFSDVKVDA